jgi:hypothetical protein
MLLTKLKVTAALVVVASVAALSNATLAHHSWAGTPAAEQPAARAAVNEAAVRNVLDKFRSFRPDDNDLAIYQLDWAPTLKDAKEKAAREQRPIFLIVVTNSFGNMYTGHC